eukprot:gene13031-biopygen8581
MLCPAANRGGSSPCKCAMPAPCPPAVAGSRMVSKAAGLQGADAERDALEVLYTELGGASWSPAYPPDDWMTSKPICTWAYVGCDASDHVTKLELQQKGLAGQLPDLSALTSLTALWMFSNQLTGTIPDLSALTSLA